MHELVTRAQATLLFSVVLPVLGLAAAWVLARRGERRGAAVVGGASVLLPLLWWTFNAILDRTGPESLVGLSACAGLFLLVGTLGGLALRPRGKRA